jgi:hypothetical protein
MPQTQAVAEQLGAGTMFISGEPMKLATKALAGLS